MRTGRPHVWLFAADPFVGKIDISGEVLALQVQKDVDGPVGNWTLRLAPRTSGPADMPGKARDQSWWLRAVQPNDVVSIGFDRPGGIALGLVDRVEVQRQQAIRNGAGTAAVVVTLSGRTMGKLLVNDHIVLSTALGPTQADFERKIAAALGSDHPLLQMIYGLRGPARGAEGDEGFTFLGAEISQAALFALRFGSTLQVPALRDAFGAPTSPRSAASAAEIIDAETFIAPTDVRLWNQNLNQYAGTVWGFLTSLIDADLFELRVDDIPRETLPGKFDPVCQPVLIIRPKPFDDPKLERARVTSAYPGRPDLVTLIEAKPYHELPNDQIWRASLGIDDRSVCSHYLVTSEYLLGSDASGAGLSYPLVDTWAARRYGLRSYRAAMSLVGGDLAQRAEGSAPYDSQLVNEATDARNRLFNWYWASARMLSGSITVEGNDNYRPGDPVFLPDEVPPLPPAATFGLREGVHFYCTQVTWAWSVGSPYECTLRLTRGYNGPLIDALKVEIAIDAPPTNPLHFAET